jgi:5'-3' exonuclease
MTAVAATETKTRVILIDLSSVFYACWHSSGGDAVSMARERTIETIRRIADKGGLAAICCDLGRSFRKDLMPAYKANRPDKDQNMLSELERTRERLRADGYLLWEVDGFEADDLIATATLAARVHGHEVLIASADKDLLQLVGGGVRQLRTHTMKEMGAQELAAEVGIGPSLFGDWLALVGDKSDNIDGCPGCGPTKATMLLKRFGGLDAVYAALATDEREVALALGSNNPKPGELAIIKSLKASIDQVRLARKIVTLRTDAPIAFSDIYQERERQPLTTFTDEPPQDAAFTPAPPAPVPAPAPPPDNTVSIGELIQIPAKQAPAPEARLATVPQPFDRQLEPVSLREAFWLSQGMHESRLYAKFGGPHAIWAAMIRGREMGYAALTSLDMFHVIEGKPSLTANAIQALAEGLPDCEYLRPLHSDAQYAEWETKHRKHPEPVKHRYTIQDAVAAGLCALEAAPRIAGPKERDQRGQWDKRRPEMLRKTAMVQLVRMVYPSAALGLYAREELSDRED